MPDQNLYKSLLPTRLFINSLSNVFRYDLILLKYVYAALPTLEANYVDHHCVALLAASPYIRLLETNLFIAAAINFCSDITLLVSNYSLP